LKLAALRLALFQQNLNMVRVHKENERPQVNPIGLPEGELNQNSTTLSADYRDRI
jgi:hypothetical protein